MSELTIREGLAYGLRLRGLDPRGLLAADGTRWPLVEVRQEGGEPPSGEPWLDGEGGLLELDGRRRLRVSRDPARASFLGPPLPADDLVHPYLAPAAIAFARWLGRETFHAGAVVAGGGAWALVGPREAGKSSLLAALAGLGAQVLTDDLVVVERRIAFAGPRSLDLRQPLPGSLANGVRLEPARGATRWRMRLEPVAPAVELHGWIFLGWGDRIELEPTGPVVTLARLARWRAWPDLPTDPVQMLDLAALSAFDLRRPQRWEALENTVAALLDAVGAP